MSFPYENSLEHTRLIYMSTSDTGGGAPPPPLRHDPPLAVAIEDPFFVAHVDDSLPDLRNGRMNPSAHTGRHNVCNQSAENPRRGKGRRRSHATPATGSSGLTRPIAQSNSCWHIAARLEGAAGTAQSWLESARDLSEIWIAYKPTPRLGKKVPFASDNRETAFVSLPAAPTLLPTKQR